MALTRESMPGIAAAPQPPVVHTGRWVLSAVAIVMLGWSSAATGAMVPLLAGVDLGIHEFGHLVMGWAPWIIGVFAGSFFQVAAPLGLSAYFGFARREVWAAGPLMAWAGVSLRNVAVYIADAPYQRLELWGGDNVVHDWAQLLAGKPMQHAEQIAWCANSLGWGLVAGGLALVAWAAFGERRAATRFVELEARKDSLPVREPRNPLG